MANGRSLAARVGTLEGKVAKLESFQQDFKKTLEREFRDQAELIDRLLILRFAELDDKFAAINENFAVVNKNFAAVNENFAAVNENFAAVNENFAAVNENFAAVNKELTTVKEGIKIILAKLR